MLITVLAAFPGRVFALATPDPPPAHLNRWYRRFGFQPG
jgi:hypothetical protein